jgi:hypothetical protein
MSNKHYQSLPTLKIEVNVPETGRYRKELLFETRLSIIMTVLKVQNRKNSLQ